MLMLATCLMSLLLTKYYRSITVSEEYHDVDLGQNYSLRFAGHELVTKHHDRNDERHQG